MDSAPPDDLKIEMETTGRFVQSITARLRPDVAAFANSLVADARSIIEGYHRYQEVHRRAFAALYRDTSDSPDDDPEVQGRFLRGLVNDLMASFAAVEGFIQTAATETGQPEVFREYTLARQGLDRAREQLDHEWPWITTDMLSEGMAAYERGECHDVETLLHVLQNQDRPSGGAGN